MTVIASTEISKISPDGLLDCASLTMPPLLFSSAIGVMSAVPSLTMLELSAVYSVLDCSVVVAKVLPKESSSAGNGTGVSSSTGKVESSSLPTAIVELDKTDWPPSFVIA